ncbi:uncharacterized protein LOC113295554 [Papaver somniferum]|uniref:uncharacterized protein LOC113295554 n=1 Tax=Papaver somniferum TaxID=3469 RepID=UPI000E703613|nr:uncharacterized protein LOC113295554 [Papaver somniferum]
MVSLVDFSVGRGLKQGDPLSPILFVLMEDVLSRNISHLVNQGKILPMVVKNGIYPTHLFFADDVFIFFNGAKKSLNNLFTLLDEYQASSGQLINKDKSKCFIDGVTSARKQQICEMVNMDLSKFPDKYLGVLLAPGRVTSAMVWPVVEMIQHRLAKWRDGLLQSSKFVKRLSETSYGLATVKLENTKHYLEKGDGANISVCFDTWYETVPKINEIGYSEVVKNNLQMKVKELIKSNQWEIPSELQSVFVLSNMLGVYIDDETMRNEGYEMPSRCFFAFPRPLSFADICKAADKQSPLIKEIWFTVVCATMKELWFQKNSILFDNGKVHIHLFKSRILQVVHEGGIRMKDFIIEIYDVVECFWEPPDVGELLLCCDGAAKGNPGNAGAGVVARDASCTVLGAISIGLGVTTNYLAEIYGIIIGLEWETKWRILRVKIRTDSKAARIGFTSNALTWFSRDRWREIQTKYDFIHFDHTFREENFAADNMAKRVAIKLMKLA